MRIMLVITGLGVGGAERLVTQFADAFIEAGHEVMLVWLVGNAELKPTDSRVQMVPLQMTKNPRSVVACVARLAQLIRDFKPDVVNSHLVHANLLTRLVRLTTRIPLLVNSAHNTNEEGRLRMVAYRATDRLVDRFTNVSDEAVQAFVDQGALRPGRMIAIDNGINALQFAFDEAARDRVRKELGVNAARRVLLAVGRLREQKDYPNLLRAFADLPPSSVQPCLVIAGEGPLRQELEKLAELLDVRDRVYFLGVRHDVAALMSAADIFVLSSAWEGLPVVLLEAMACERTVVATDTGSIRQVLNGIGLLVPPRCADALAQGLASALSLTAAERALHGSRARQRVIEKFSIAATAKRYLEVFNAQSDTKSWLKG